MTLKILILVIFVGKALLNCNPGCLKCSSTNNCIFCDASRNYYISGVSCILSIQASCNFIAQNGNCVQCNKNFFIDQNSQKCIQVTNTSVIANCQSYQLNQACLVCAPPYYLSNNLCTISNVTISNCAVYSANGICSQCNTGYIFSNDFSSCQAIPTSINCLQYTYVSCQKCKTGTIFNQNSYFANFQSPNFLTNTFLTTLSQRQSVWISAQVCQQTTVSNCETYLNFQQCSSCLSGFYLLNGNCIAFPLSIIQNCLNYLSLTVCIGCQSGYYLNLNQCVRNVNITNCLNYDSTASRTTCLQCNSQTYLQANACVLRTLSSSINNCATLSLTSDTCAVCSTGNQISSDGFACFPVVLNCIIYATSNKNSGSLKCTGCATNYYLSSSATETVCMAGTVQNCNTYLISANTCLICNNGFYLSNGICISHVSITNCQVYSQINMNSCNFCSIGFYSFVYKTICVQVQTILNCLTYSADGLTCLVCSAGYYLSGQFCLQIPTTLTNCINYNGVSCSLCSNGSMLNLLTTNYACISPLDYLTTNCVLVSPGIGVAVSWSANVASTLTCSYCNSNSYPYNPLNSEAICVLSTQLSIYSSYNQVIQCKRYGLNYMQTPQIVCMECLSPNFLSNYWGSGIISTATNCVNICPTSAGLNTIIADDLFGFVNICVQTGTDSNQISSTSCQKYVRTTSQTGTISDYRCVLASNNHMLSFTVPSIGYAYEQNSVLSTTITTISSEFYHGFQTSDLFSTFPTLLNYHGILLESVRNPNNFGSSIYTNCDIIWTIGSGTVKGSAYRPFISNTMPFIPLTIPQSSCLRCSFGYQIAYLVTSTTLANGGNAPLPVCVSMGSLCLSSIVYGGLPSFLNVVFSCHSCPSTLGSFNYPTIMMEFDAISTAGNGAGNFLQYSLPVLSNTIAFSPNGFTCGPALIPIATSSSTPTSTQTVTNCAAFGILAAIVSSGTPPLTSNTFNYCLACSTGYFPVYLSFQSSSVGSFPTYAPPFIVQQCIQSSNCNQSPSYLPFNTCSSCAVNQQGGTNPIFYAFTDFKLINCLPANTKNCFILTGSLGIPTKNTCGVCLAGYFLNKDKICEQLQLPNTLSGSTFANSYYANFILGFKSAVVTNFDATAIRINYLLISSGMRYGVSACSSSYIMAPISTWAPTLCVQSSYLQQISQLPINTLFIQNCINYNFLLNGSLFTCIACAVGWIPVSDGTSCVNSLSNCLLAQLSPNTSSCQTCVNGFLNIFGNCAKPAIQNCQVYVNTVSSFTARTIQCQTCAPGYFASIDKVSCFLGSVLNCAVYQIGSATQCLACLNNFLLMTISKSVSYCFPIAPSLNCNSLQDPSNSGANSALLVCTNCTTTGSQIYGLSQFNPTSNQAQTVCLPFNQIQNCGIYDQNNTSISMNSFSCIQCGQGYWYSSLINTCVQRTNMPFQCVTYSLSADICSVCQSGTFLSSDARFCIPFPNGIYNCATYSFVSTCTSCNSGFYLVNNQCFQSSIILNCFVYSGNNTCAVCVQNSYLASPTSCVIAQAQNCLTYASASACQSCPSGFGLVFVNQITNCVFASASNCAIPTTVYPFSCLTCVTNYYPDYLGNCQLVGLIIQNCLYYDTNLTCRVCVSNTVLSVSKTACIQNTYSAYIDGNCLQSVLTGFPICAMCTFGSFFKNGTCSQCNATLLSNGCMSCDPNGENVCLICLPGYYQTSNMSCNQIGALPINNTNTTPTNFTPSSSAQITSIWMFIVILLRSLS